MKSQLLRDFLPFIARILLLVGSTGILQSTVAAGKAYRPVRGKVMVFLATECPISQRYAQSVNQLVQHFPQINFTAVFTKWDKPVAIQDFVQTYQLKAKVLRDARHSVAKRLGATVTPEAFLFNERGSVIYRGAIDNGYEALGKARPQPTRFYLKEAIEAYLNHQPIRIKKTKAVGCIIES